MKFGFLLDGLFIIACIGTVRSIRNIDGELFELSVIHLNDFHARYVVKLVFNWFVRTLHVVMFDTLYNFVA